MNYPEDDQNEINRLHNEFVHHSPRSNDDLIALQDASYALGLKRGQAHEAALQQRLNEADQRIDELVTANEILAEGLRALATVKAASSVAHARTMAKQALNKCHGFLNQLTKDRPESES